VFELGFGYGKLVGVGVLEPCVRDGGKDGILWGVVMGDEVRG